MDPYKILKVKKNATGETIKKAYRRASMRWHPDRNPGDEKAGEEFRKVQLAYQILSDPARRARYDATGDVSESRPDNGIADFLPTISNLLVGVVNAIRKAGVNPSTKDLIAKVREAIAVPMEGMKSGLLEASKEKLDWEKLLPRFEVKKEGEHNFMADLVSGRIRDLKEKMSEMEKAIEQGKGMLAFLDNFSFRKDTQCPKPLPPSYGIDTRWARTSSSNSGDFMAFIMDEVGGSEDGKEKGK